MKHCWRGGSETGSQVGLNEQVGWPSGSWSAFPRAPLEKHKDQTSGVASSRSEKAEDTASPVFVTGEGLQPGLLTPRPLCPLPCESVVLPRPEKALSLHQGLKKAACS